MKFLNNLKNNFYSQRPYFAASRRLKTCFTHFTDWKTVRELTPC